MDGLMSLAGPPDPVREEVPSSTSPPSGAPTSVDVGSRGAVADGAVERPSACLASPFPVCAMGSGWAIMSETNFIKRGGKAADTATATNDATESAVSHGGERELSVRALLLSLCFLFSLCFRDLDRFRLNGESGGGASNGSNRIVSCDPSGNVSKAKAGGSLSVGSGSFGAESDIISSDVEK